jgi:hypothetical protein
MLRKQWLSLHYRGRAMSKHTCHWPGCAKAVPPAMWGCKPHWYALPKALRDRILATYRPGQEITKTPSVAYVQAAQDAQAWINASTAGTESRRRLPAQGGLA